MAVHRISGKNDLSVIKDTYIQKVESYEYRILVCGGAGCVSSGCAEIQESIYKSLKELEMGEKVLVMETGCMGTCAVGPVMLIQPQGVFFVKLTPAIVYKVLSAYFKKGEILLKHTFFDHSLRKNIPNISDIDFFRQQVKVALRNCGEMEHASIEAYISRDGYQAAYDALAGKSSEEVVNEVKKSGLMGRGGAGFPTGIKWEAGLKASGERKYIVCNADEGDPGAFMDRSIIEGDPHSLIEGMLLDGADELY